MTKRATSNTLYYGDNLDVLRRHVADESVDLVYLDPPFNSNANYNVLFAAKDGHQAAAQIQAFEDSWRWDQAAARQFDETVEAGGSVADVLLAFKQFLGTNDMLAYLTMMAPRLVELRRVLKPTGSLYLHCDPTASHYLKLLLDAVFGPEHFLNEIIWKRTTSHSGSKRWGPVHDSILLYSVSDEHTWNPMVQAYDEGYLSDKYKYTDERGQYRLSDLTANGVRTGTSGEAWKEISPTPLGRHWAVPSGVVAGLASVVDADAMSTQEKLDLLEANGFIYWPSRGRGGGTGFPQYKRYLGAGNPIHDVVTDLAPINSQAKERLGYPTQKPVALLERIISASSNAGDVVLDPFCGCGTTIEAAQKLGRSWIGIDITHLAISLIKIRLRDAFGEAANFEVTGEPTTAEDAAALAESDKYQFQWWALGLVGARPVDQKKGADKGIDGRLYFHDGSEKTRQIIFSVKGGRLHATDVRDLRGVVEREKAEIGVLLSFESATKPMKVEANSAGFYTSPWGKHSRIQLLTVAEILAGNAVDYPKTAGVNQTYKQAPKAIRKVAEPLTLFESAPEDPTPKKSRRGR
jgi:DNA modification methylase